MFRKIPIITLLLAVCGAPFSIASAAGIDYENGLGIQFSGLFGGDGRIYSDQDLDDPFDDYDLGQGGSQSTILSERGNGAAADSYNDNLTTVTLGTGASYINDVTVNRSALTATGFSTDSNVLLDAGDGSLTQESQNAGVQQLVEMTFTETTTLYLSHTYDSLLNTGVGHTGLTYAIWNKSFCNFGDASCEMFASSSSWDETSASVGGSSASVTLGPGDYMFFMSAGASYDYGRTADDLGFNSTVSVSTIPVPAAVWLFASALAGLFGFRKAGV